MIKSAGTALAKEQPKPEALPAGQLPEGDQFRPYLLTATRNAAIDTLRRGGIENISLDLIFALPPHLGRSWESDLVRALDLAPAHISLYGLTVEAQTPIARWADRGAVVQGTDENYEEEFLSANAMMTEMIVS